jgi:hypothetical protein
MLYKIISGGQTGADRAGLKAAKASNIETGGWMPKGFITHDGHHPEFAELYNIKEHNSDKYPPRTFTNVANSTGTVRFAIDFDSPGEKLTLTAITKTGKPHFDVNVLGDTKPDQLAKWIIDNNIEVLNVAGNSEKTAAGIEEFVFAFLMETIATLTSIQSPAT